MKYLLIACFILLSTATGFTQEKSLAEQLEAATADSTRVRLLKELSKTLINTNPDLSKEYAEKCLNLSRKTGNKDGEAGASNLLGSLALNHGDYLEATDLYLKALRIYKDLDNKRLIAVVYNNIGTLNMKQGNLKEARNNLDLSIRLKEEMNITKGLANCYQTLASVCFLEKDNEQALIYFEKGRQLAREMHDERVELSCINGLASVQFKKENYKEAIKGYNQALEITQKMEGDNRKEMAGLYHNLASAYRKLGDFDKAIELLNASLKLAKEIQSNEDIKQAYSGLKSYYKDKGDLANALIAQEYYSVYKDSTVNENTLKAINELQEKYKAEERKKEIVDLQNANGQLEEKSTLQYSLLIVSVGAFVLTTLAVFFYMKQLKAKQQRKQAELEQKALRSQMNPHFIFNSLNSIQRMYIEGDEDTANDYMADFSRLLRSILENSGKDVIRLKDELDVIKLYMDLEMIRTDNSFDYSCELADDVDPLLVKIPPLIFQPYLENAIWHGIISKKEKGTIQLSIQRQQQGKLVCQITDNGIGFYSGKKLKPAKDNKSRGMQITAERLGGEDHVVVEELSTGGTKITLTIHYTV